MNLGICEYVIQSHRQTGETLYYYGKIGGEIATFGPSLAEAKRYDDTEELRDELESIRDSSAMKIVEIQRCPKCKKEFTDYPALSREDNETEICPDCGIREAIAAAF